MTPRRLVLSLSLILFVCSTAPHAAAQHDCKFGSEEAANKLEDDLEHAKSCKEAAELFNECRWGSSADSSFGATAVMRCEKEFYKKLTTLQKNNYADEMQLCAYQFSRQQGTMYISAAATCQVDLAASIATDPHIADKPIPRASFDCSRAQSPLEKAICSDAGLGRADVVLGRIYQQDLKLLKDLNRATFIDNEKKWLKEILGKCGLDSGAPSRKALNCLRNAFEIRFSSLDSCGDDEPSACVRLDSDPEDFRESQGEDDSTAPRASFDCNAPATALQIVICDDHDLGQKDLAVAHAFDTAISGSDAATRSLLDDSQRKWLEYVRSRCSLGTVGGVPPLLTRGCIRSAYEIRARQLDSCMKQPVSNRGQCLNEFKIVEQ